jgi:hypothetical protein
MRLPTVESALNHFAELCALRRIERSRDSVLDCGSPLPLSAGTGTCQSARGLAQPKTWRPLGRFMEGRL